MRYVLVAYQKERLLLMWGPDSETGSRPSGAFGVRSTLGGCTLVLGLYISTSIYRYIHIHMHICVCIDMYTVYVYVHIYIYVTSALRFQALQPSVLPQMKLPSSTSSDPHLPPSGTDGSAPAKGRSPRRGDAEGQCRSRVCSV